MKCSKCANECIPGLKYCQICKERNSERKKLYYKKHREEILLKQKAYAKAHPEKVREIKRKEYEKNKESYQDYQKQKYLNNKDTMNEQNKQYRKDNFLELQKYRKENIDNRHANFSRHRAIKAGAAFIEHINRLEIFERDLYICQICRESTLPNEHSTHALYPTIDHIIPLSKGGNHTFDNVQCAHFKCNTLKSNKI